MKNHQSSGRVLLTTYGPGTLNCNVAAVAALQLDSFSVCGDTHDTANNADGAVDMIWQASGGNVKGWRVLLGKRLLAWRSGIHLALDARVTAGDAFWTKSVVLK